jgi:hypothetical protein
MELPPAMEKRAIHTVNATPKRRKNRHPSQSGNDGF